MITKEMVLGILKNYLKMFIIWVSFAAGVGGATWLLAQQVGPVVASSLLWGTALATIIILDRIESYKRIDETEAKLKKMDDEFRERILNDLRRK